jgi:hypothetical protein
MTLICGETSLFESQRILVEQRTPVTYMQYRACVDLLEALALHDHIVVLMGTERDSAFADRYKPLVGLMRHWSITVKHVSAGEVESLLGEGLRSRVNSSLRQVYGPLGVRVSELVTKGAKDRYGAEFADWLGAHFAKAAATSDWGGLAKEIAEYVRRDANNPEVHFFLRGHLLNAIADSRGWTALLSGTRAVAGVLEYHLTSRGSPHSPGALVYAILNSVWKQRVAAVSRSETYPLSGFLPAVMFDRANAMSDVLDEAMKIRQRLVGFRKAYGDLAGKLHGDASSVADRESALNRLRLTADSILIPLARSANPEPRRFIVRLMDQFVQGPLQGLQATASASADSPGTGTTLSGDPVRLFASSVSAIMKVAREQPAIRVNAQLLQLLGEALDLPVPLRGVKRHIPMKGYPAPFPVALEKAHGFLPTAGDWSAP